MLLKDININNFLFGIEVKGSRFSHAAGKVLKFIDRVIEIHAKRRATRCMCHGYNVSIKIA